MASLNPALFDSVSSIGPRCVARSTVTWAPWSIARTALVMLLAQCPQAVSLTSKVTLLITSGLSRSPLSSFLPFGGVKPIRAKVPDA
jgi:hypothetical protein